MAVCAVMGDVGGWRDVVGVETGTLRLMVRQVTGRGVPHAGGVRAHDVVATRREALETRRAVALCPVGVDGLGSLVVEVFPGREGQEAEVGGDGARGDMLHL